MQVRNSYNVNYSGAWFTQQDETWTNARLVGCLRFTFPLFHAILVQNSLQMYP